MQRSQKCPVSAEGLDTDAAMAAADLYKNYSLATTLTGGNVERSRAISASLCSQSRLLLNRNESLQTFVFAAVRCLAHKRSGQRLDTWASGLPSCTGVASS